MDWMHRFSRNLGLMIHNIKHPQADADQGTRQEIRRTVQEEKLDSTTTLRRTTIEEIEIKNPALNEAPPRDEPSDPSEPSEPS